MNQTASQMREPSSTPNNPRKNRTRQNLFMILGMVVACLGVCGYLYWHFIGSNHVSTDNAYVGAEIALITPAVSGIVKEVRVVNTDIVKEGDIVVVIDDVDAKLALNRAESDFSRSEAELERSKLDLNRRKMLSSSGSVSKEELSNAQNAFKVAESAFLTMKSNLEQARINLERTIIRAPINGTVALRQVQLGQHVSPGINLLSIVPISEVHVDANFKEVDLRKIKIAQPVKLESDLYGSSVIFHGRVVGFSGGTGSAFSLIPAQNATGNWIKVVQRLPVRITLDKEELKEHPLQVGLSMYADIDVSSVEP